MKVSVRKTSNKKVIAKKPLTNLYEMNSSEIPCKTRREYIEIAGKDITLLCCESNVCYCFIIVSRNTEKMSIGKPSWIFTFAWLIKGEHPI